MRDVNEKKEFARNLELRTKNYAVSVIKIMRDLPKSDESRIIKNQIVRSATSVGANYREANRARSKADFRNKIKICEAEASETVYWLEILIDLEWLPVGKLEDLKANVSEFLAIFSSTIKKLNA